MILPASSNSHSLNSSNCAPLNALILGRTVVANRKHPYQHNKRAYRFTPMGLDPFQYNKQLCLDNPKRTDIISVISFLGRHSSPKLPNAVATSL